MNPEKHQTKHESIKSENDSDSPENTIDSLALDFAKRISGIGAEEENVKAQYQYSNVNLESVVKNIDEYIIPECQQACRLLWSKNIETFMVSNYEDKFLYVLIADLSEDNQKIFDELSKGDNRYFFDEYRHFYGIRVNGTDQNSVNELNFLTNIFEMQDVNSSQYKTAEEFLANFKCKGGPASVDEYGNIIRDINPLLINASLVDALQATNSEDLYVREENRVYQSQLFLDWHNRYKQNINLTNN